MLTKWQNGRTIDKRKPGTTARKKWATQRFVPVSPSLSFSHSCLMPWRWRLWLRCCVLFDRFLQKGGHTQTNTQHTHETNNDVNLFELRPHTITHSHVHSVSVCACFGVSFLSCVLFCAKSEGNKTVCVRICLCVPHFSWVFFFCCCNNRIVSASFYFSLLDFFSSVFPFQVMQMWRRLRSNETTR